MIDKIKTEHKISFSRFTIMSGITAGIIYFLGIIFVDVLKYPYYLVGILLTPFAFTSRYFLSKYWVFKNG